MLRVSERLRLRVVDLLVQRYLATVSRQLAKPRLQTDALQKDDSDRSRDAELQLGDGLITWILNEEV